MTIKKTFCQLKKRNHQKLSACLKSENFSRKNWYSLLNKSLSNTWYRQQYRLQRWQSTKPSFIQEYIDKANAPTMPSHIRSYYYSGTNWRTKEDNVIVDTFPQDPTLNKRVLDNSLP
ncbi:UNVERIFIED_CONTAM: hypothetical protein Cloal_1935 [Acetivibrio alkalicellulosi]